MKSKIINTPAAGTWARDCELIALYNGKEFRISYHKDEDDTYWSMCCEGMVAYKVLGEELSGTGYLMNLPVEGAFFEIMDSPWMNELKREKSNILDQCKHYVLKFYDQLIELIAQKLVFELLKEKPSFNAETP